MKQFEIDFEENPSFDTVVNLINRTFDGDIVSGRGATEDQLLILYNKIQELADKIQTCCNTDHSEDITQQLMEKLDDLENRILQCCNRTQSIYTGDGGGCDGNLITVTFGWNGDPFVDGGQATAISSDSSRSIVGYSFLVYNSSTGIYQRSSTAFGGDWQWSISSTGRVTGSYAGAVGAGHTLAFAKEIIAIDSQGCEGGTPVSLPIGHGIGP